MTRAKGIGRRRIGTLALSAAISIAGCSAPTKAPGTFEQKNAFWSGRLALQVQSDPPQAFFAGFELKGDPRSGELLLFSPLGSTLAALSWTPTTAVLKRSEEVRQYDSVDALVKAATGASFPVETLFEWLDGVNASVSGWNADLSRLDDGRLTAVRNNPPPAAELKIVLEK